MGWYRTHKEWFSKVDNKFVSFTTKERNILNSSADEILINITNIDSINKISEIDCDYMGKLNKCDAIKEYNEKIKDVITKNEQPNIDATFIDARTIDLDGSQLTECLSRATLNKKYLKYKYKYIQLKNII